MNQGAVNQGRPQQADCDSGNSAAPQKERQPGCNCLEMALSGAGGLVMPKTCTNPECQCFTGSASSQGIQTRPAMPLLPVRGAAQRGPENSIFKCHKCGKDTDIAPDPPELAVCSDCCEDHNYVYIRGERRHACEYCGVPCPDDWFDE